LQVQDQPQQFFLAFSLVGWLKLAPFFSDPLLFLTFSFYYNFFANSTKIYLMWSPSFAEHSI